MSVTGIRLGYVVDRKQPTRLIPAWVFDASYTKSSVESGKGGFAGTDMTVIPRPFAVNALSGELVPLWQ
jgi:hypothetical protein